MNLIRLKDVLKEKGMSGKELAERVGVSQPAISDIVNEKSFPRPELLKQISEVLDVDIRDLFIKTKDEGETESIYVKRDGNYIPIGKIKKAEI